MYLTRSQVRASMEPIGDPMGFGRYNDPLTAGAGISAGMSLLGGLAGADTARGAANKQEDALRAATGTVTQTMKPYTEAGTAATQRLSAGVAPGGEFAKQFSMADARNSEAMKFALSQGSEAIQNSAAARGGLIGTNVLQDLTKFGQQAGSQYEAQAFDQFIRERQSQLQPLEFMQGQGQQAATGVASDVANMQLGIGNVQAAGQTAQNKALLGGISGGMDQYAMLKKIFDPGVNTNPVSGTNPTFSTPGDMGFEISDERLKDNARRVGYTDDGLPIYTYTMGDNSKHKMGVMAQDVAKMKPEAVARGDHGFMMVNYGRI